MRQGKDSVTWAAIPVGTEVVMGYVPPSRFAWPAQAWARFAGSVLVRITPSASVWGRGIHVLDVETGDATPAQVPGWALASRGAGQEPTVYTAYGNWAACIQACINAGVTMPQWWIADWNDRQDLPTIVVHGVTYTAVAHQYADPATSGGDWDSSVVAPYWPGVDGTAPNALTPTETDMPSYQTDLPAGNDLHVNSCVAGCAAIYFPGGYSDALTVHQLDFFGATPSDPAPAATGVGGGHDPGLGDWTVDPNRAGPVPVPPGAVMVTVRYSTSDSTWKLAAGPLPA